MNKELMVVSVKQHISAKIPIMQQPIDEQIRYHLHEIERLGALKEEGETQRYKEIARVEVYYPRGYEKKVVEIKTYPGGMYLELFAQKKRVGGRK